MYTCKKCNFISEKAINFCPQCGTEMEQNEYVVTTEVSSAPVQPTYVSPVSYAPVKKPNLAKKIVGMALSIEGFVLAIITVLYSIIMSLAEPVAGFIMALYLSIFGFPGSIIGFIFSSAARNCGDNSAMSRVGKSLGLAGIIITGVTLFLTFLIMVSEF